VRRLILTHRPFELPLDEALGLELASDGYSTDV